MWKRVRAGDASYPADHFNSIISAIATLQQTIFEWSGEAHGIVGSLGNFKSQFGPIFELLPAFVQDTGPDGEPHTPPEYWVRVVPSHSTFEARAPWNLPDLSMETAEERRLNIVKAFNLSQVKGRIPFDPVLDTPLIVARYQRWSGNPWYVFSATSGTRWVSIVSAMQHAPYVWKYTAVEVEMDEDLFNIIPPGTAIPDIFNTMEMRNPPGGGLMGNGVNTNDLPPGFTLGPVAQCVVPLSPGGYISVPNPIVGSCGQ